MADLYLYVENQSNIVLGWSFSIRPHAEMVHVIENNDLNAFFQRWTKEDYMVRSKVKRKRTSFVR